jgi:hypothetical protein
LACEAVADPDDERIAGHLQPELPAMTSGLAHGRTVPLTPPCVVVAVGARAHDGHVATMLATTVRRGGE